MSKYVHGHKTQCKLSSHVQLNEKSSLAVLIEQLTAMLEYSYCMSKNGKIIVLSIFTTNEHDYSERFEHLKISIAFMI